MHAAVSRKPFDALLEFIESKHHHEDHEEVNSLHRQEKAFQHCVQETLGRMIENMSQNMQNDFSIE